MSDFFLVFIIPIYCGLSIIFLQNPIYIVFFFIVIVIHMAIFLLFIGLEFFAFILLIVYVGAIAILFIFMVMLLNIKLFERVNLNFNKNLLFVLSVLSMLIVWIYGGKEMSQLDYYVHEYMYTSYVDDFYFYDLVKVMGILMYKLFSVFVFGVALFLLIAIVGSITLTYNQVAAYKRVDMFKQIERSFVKLLKFKRSCS